MKKIAVILSLLFFVGCSYDCEPTETNESTTDNVTVSNTSDELSIHACGLTMENPYLYGEYLTDDTLNLYWNMVDCVCDTPEFENEFGFGRYYCDKTNTSLDDWCDKQMAKGYYDDNSCTSARHVTNRAIDAPRNSYVVFSDSCRESITECRSH